MQRLQMFAGRKCGIDLDGPVPLYYSLARARKDGPSAAAASCRSLDNRRAEASVELLHQFPSTPIRHPQGAACRRDRTRAGNFLQNGNLSGSDPSAGYKVKPNAQAVTGA